MCHVGRLTWCWVWIWSLCCVNVCGCQTCTNVCRCMIVSTCMNVFRCMNVSWRENAWILHIWIWHDVRMRVVVMTSWRYVDFAFMNSENLWMCHDMYEVKESWPEYECVMTQEMYECVIAWECHAHTHIYTQTKTKVLAHRELNSRTLKHVYICACV